LGVSKGTFVNDKEDRLVIMIRSDVGCWRRFAKEMSGCDCQEADYALTTFFFVTAYSGEANSYNEERKRLVITKPRVVDY
jgi:hypothetical protein